MEGKPDMVVEIPDTMVAEPDIGWSSNGETTNHGGFNA